MFWILKDCIPELWDSKGVLVFSQNKKLSSMEKRLKLWIVVISTSRWINRTYLFFLKCHAFQTNALRPDVKSLVVFTNRRIILAGGDMWRWSSPTSCLKQDQLDQVAQGLVQWVWSIYKTGDFTNTLVPCCSISTTLMVFFLSLYQAEISLAATVASHPVPLHLWEESGSIFFTSSTMLSSCR